MHQSNRPLHHLMLTEISKLSITGDSIRINGHSLQLMKKDTGESDDEQRRNKTSFFSAC